MPSAAARSNCSPHPLGCAILLAHGFSIDMSRLSDEWSDDDFDVLADGVVVGRTMKAMAPRRGGRGCGRWPLGIMRTTRRPTATRRRARPNLSGMTLLEQLVVPSRGPLPCRTHGGSGRCALRSD